MSDTATQLRAATRRCIARYGLAATTSRRITAEAGANLGAITYHYESKDRLVAEALLEGLRDLLSPALDLLDAPGDPATRTIEIVRVLLAALDERRDDAVAYVQALAHAPTSGALRTGIAEMWTDLRGRIATDVRSLQADGTVGSWVDADAMSGVFLAVANGLLIQAVVDPAGPETAELAAQFVGLILHDLGLVELGHVDSPLRIRIHVRAKP